MEAPKANIIPEDHTLGTPLQLDLAEREVVADALDMNLGIFAGLAERAITEGTMSVELKVTWGTVLRLLQYMKDANMDTTEGHRRLGDVFTSMVRAGLILSS